MQKILMMLGMLFILNSCAKEKDTHRISRITENSLLVSNQTNGTYDLWVKRSWEETIKIKEVTQIGWNEHEILVYGRNQNEEGWVYIIDDNSYETSWGTYTDKEFPIWAKELGIENKFELMKPETIFRPTLYPVREGQNGTGFDLY